jgi:hypothetical protein
LELPALADFKYFAETMQGPGQEVFVALLGWSSQKILSINQSLSKMPVLQKKFIQR